VYSEEREDESQA